MLNNKILTGAGILVVLVIGALLFLTPNGEEETVTQEEREEEVAIQEEHEEETEREEKPTTADKVAEWDKDLLEDERDGQAYRVVTIGEQTWMADNLNYETQEGSWCYENNPSNCDAYGRLYTWETTMDKNKEEAAQGICPEGWHIPTDEEWQDLEREIGMKEEHVELGVRDFGSRRDSGNAGDKLKDPQGNWCSNPVVCGEAGFKALPSGHKGVGDDFFRLELGTYFWTSSTYGYGLDSDSPIARGMRSSSEIERATKQSGQALSIRCIKN